MLIHEGHPIAFISKKLATRHLSLSVHEKDLMAIIQAMEKWRHYLIGQHFIIRAYHLSVKYLLDPRLHNESQFHWLARLIGFDYEICFRKGKVKMAADALSCIHGPELLAITLTLQEGTLLDDIKKT